jgi:hypothetical protein
MAIIGLLLLAAAVAAAAIFIVQNRSTTLDIHGLGNTWHVHLYWVLVAGMVIALVALVGFRAMTGGAGRAVRQRRERRGLVRENERLADIVERQNAESAEAAAAPAPVVTPVAPAAVQPEPAGTVPVVDTRADTGVMSGTTRYPTG